MSLHDSHSFIIHQPSNSSIENGDDVDSLPSSIDSSDLSNDGSESDAEREWHESLQQIELLLTMVLVPYLGKYFGRKCAYWGMFFHGSSFDSSIFLPELELTINAI